ncbi:MAG: M23 family metallopeptidase [Flavobacteriales bacterium]|nr:M23 family metallopeptidase [Flavobacteriales bacterium]
MPRAIVCARPSYKRPSSSVGSHRASAESASTRCRSGSRGTLGCGLRGAHAAPILAVGDGVVEKAGRTAGNGNYVKLRHNGTYSTQYLHMRKILVKQGQRVSQGDVLGEVGSTGLATGPHVCFRFWKNGQQVDHRREEFPSAEPVAEVHRARFAQERDRLVEALAQASGRADQTVVF